MKPIITAYVVPITVICQPTKSLFLRRSSVDQIRCSNHKHAIDAITIATISETLSVRLSMFFSVLLRVINSSVLGKCRRVNNLNYGAGAIFRLRTQGNPYGSRIINSTCGLGKSEGTHTAKLRDRRMASQHGPS